jgi:hypothetical protein
LLELGITICFILCGVLIALAIALFKRYRPTRPGPAPRSGAPEEVNGSIFYYGPGGVRRRRLFRDPLIKLGRVRRHRGRLLLECPYCGALGTPELFPTRVPTENISLYTHECTACDCLFRIESSKHADRFFVVRGYIKGITQAGEPKGVIV